LHTKSTLLNDLRNLKILSTDYLTVHTSLKQIGPISAGDSTGAEVFIEALRASVSDGMLMIPTHTFSTVTNGSCFDVRKTLPCIGTVPTVAVKLANEAYDSGNGTCIRSLHPTHSVVVFGKEAQAFTFDDRYAVKRMDPCGCYSKFLKKGGKILLAGVGLESNTFIHLVDEFYDPEHFGRINYITSIDYDGTQYPRQMQSGGGSSHLFGQYQSILNAAGAITYGKIGSADAMLCDARKLYDAIFAAKKAGFKLIP